MRAGEHGLGANGDLRTQLIELFRDAPDTVRQEFDIEVENGKVVAFSDDKVVIAARRSWRDAVKGGDGIVLRIPGPSPAASTKAHLAKVEEAAPNLEPRVAPSTRRPSTG